MIEIRKNTDPEVKRRALLFVDGVLLENAFVDTHWDSGNSCSITSLDLDTSEMLAAYRLSDFPLPPEQIELQFYPNDLPHANKEAGTVIATYGEPDLTISLSFGGDVLTQWTASYTFADYIYEMYAILEGRDGVHGTDLIGKLDEVINFYKYDSQEYKIDGYGKIPLHLIEKHRIHALYVRFKFSRDAIIANEVERISRIIKQIHSEIIARISHSVVITLDNFPKEVRTPCEQYLLYFIQFLQDLGVDATSEIKHESGKVLFTVTPSNENEALDKIRTALNVYLHLPSNPIGNNPSTDIAVNRLESAVFRLHSDLRLAAAELQAKNATIEAQQLTINVQRSLLSGEISPVAQDKDREEFLDGAVALTVMKKEGVELNLAKIYRMLKDYFIEKE
jgi:hypothetical protein